MKCPYCQQDIQLPDYARHNINAYEKALLVTTKCCYQIVKLIPIRSFKVEKSRGENGDNGPEDDWGVPEGEDGRLTYEKQEEGYRRMGEEAIKRRFPNL